MNRFANRLASLLLVATAVTMFTFHDTGAQISINQVSSTFEPIRLEDQSRLWIEGITNINSYQCNADTIAGFGRLEEPQRTNEIIESHESVVIDVKIPVYELDCGKKAMNKDMYEALKAGSHPQIHYQLKESDFIENIIDDGEEWMKIMSTGIIKVAGVEKEISIPVLGKVLDNNRFHVKGEKELLMSEFDIEPPTALLGLIKAKENITIKFDVIVMLDGVNF